jgi:hypothetical protein
MDGDVGAMFFVEGGQMFADLLDRIEGASQRIAWTAQTQSAARMRSMPHSENDT